MDITKEYFESIFFDNTASEIGKILGVSRETVNQYAKKLGLKKGKGYHAKKVNFIDQEMWSK